MPHKVFGKLTIQMFEIIDECLKTQKSIEIGDILKRLTLDALTLAGFGMRQLNITLSILCMVHLLKEITGFEINALKDPDNEWLRTYQSIINGMQDPLFFFFPILEARFLHMFPKRKLIHDDCDRFLKLMDEMIEEKRKVVNDSVKSETLERIQEKDILTMLLESEKSGDDSDTYMTNEELKVQINFIMPTLFVIKIYILFIPLKSNLCIFFSAGNSKYHFY